MSVSRTPPSALSTNISSSSESTSRLATYENPSSAHVFRERERHSASPSTVLNPFPSRTPETNHSLSQFRHLVDNTPDHLMAKRFHQEPSEVRGRPDSRSSPSTDSQGGMADTEMEAGRTHQSEMSPPPTVPPKKKRTRTLTTPHQSAVLHALLAQSRFPTTAMREEVGRSIGLSARKVQIWFQNQRQKARRPRSQNDAPLTRPPQYGPFPGAPGSAAVGLHVDESNQGPSSWGSNLSASSGHSFTNKSPDQPVVGRYHSSQSYLGSVESTSKLLGPGMPGQDLWAGIPSRGQDLHMHSPKLGPLTFSRSLTSRLYPPSQNPVDIPLHTARPTSAQTTGSKNPGFSRTLPPLNFDSHSRGSFSAPGSHHTYHSFAHSMPSATFPRASSNSPSDSPFAHHPPEQSPRQHLGIPPPFTLQPAPQWDASAPRPQRSPWSSSGSRCGRESSRDTSDPEIQSFPADERILRLEPPSRPRSGRYDPVRATVIPYPTPTPPSAKEGHSDPEP